MSEAEETDEEDRDKRQVTEAPGKDGDSCGTDTEKDGLVKDDGEEGEFREENCKVLSWIELICCHLVPP